MSHFLPLMSLTQGLDNLEWCLSLTSFLLPNYGITSRRLPGLVIRQHLIDILAWVVLSHFTLWRLSITCPFQCRPLSRCIDLHRNFVHRQVHKGYHSQRTIDFPGVIWISRKRVGICPPPPVKTITTIDIIKNSLQFLDPSAILFRAARQVVIPSNTIIMIPVRMLRVSLHHL